MSTFEVGAAGVVDLAVEEEAAAGAMVAETVLLLESAEMLLVELRVVLDNPGVLVVVEVILLAGSSVETGTASCDTGAVVEGRALGGVVDGGVIVPGFVAALGSLASEKVAVGVAVDTESLPEPPYA